jgi:hypothetical protein
MPVVERGVTYRGTSLVEFVSDVPRIVLRCVSGLDSGPQVRGVDTLIPSAAGMVPRNRVRHIRRIVLEGFVMGTGADHDAQRADFRDAIEEMRDLFDPTLSAGTLIVDLEDGGTATISARTMPEEPEWGEDSLPTYRALSVELEAVGDDWVITPAGS